MRARVLPGCCEAWQRTLDHLIVGRKREAKVPWELHPGSRQDEDIVGEQHIGKGPIIRPGRLRQEVEGPLGHMHLVAHPSQGADQEVALLLQVRDINGELLQVGQGVLKQCIRDGIAAHQLRERQGTAHLLPVRHRGWQSHVAKPLTGREERLSIRIDEERTGIEGGRAVIGAAVEDDTGVGFVGEQVDRAAVAFGRCRQGSSELVQCLRRVDLAGRIVGGVDDDGACAARRWPRWRLRRGRR